MVVDTSTVLAILLGEPEGAAMARAMEATPRRLMSAASLLEASMVVETCKGEAAGRELDLLIYRAAIEIVPVDHHQVETARIAWRRYGKGRHAAGLNYGDCFSYALAKASGLPLLFKGEDFSQTDVAAYPWR